MVEGRLQSYTSSALVASEAAEEVTVFCWNIPWHKLPCFGFCYNSRLVGGYRCGYFIYFVIKRSNIRQEKAQEIVPYCRYFKVTVEFVLFVCLYFSISLFSWVRGNFSFIVTSLINPSVFIIIINNNNSLKRYLWAIQFRLVCDNSWVLRLLWWDEALYYANPLLIVSLTLLSLFF